MQCSRWRARSCWAIDDRQPRLLCVRVTTEAGLHGHAFALSRELPSDAFIQQSVAPLLIGHDSDLIGERMGDCYAALAAPSRVGMVKRALSLVEIALWDVKGHRLDTPVWRLLGGARSQVPVVMVGGYLTADTTPEAVGAKLGDLAAAGLPLPQDRPHPDSRADPASDRRGASVDAAGMRPGGGYPLVLGYQRRRDPRAGRLGIRSRPGMARGSDAARGLGAVSRAARAVGTHYRRRRRGHRRAGAAPADR